MSSKVQDASASFCPEKFKTHAKNKEKPNVYIESPDLLEAVQKKSEHILLIIPLWEPPITSTLEWVVLEKESGAFDKQIATLKA